MAAKIQKRTKKSLRKDDGKVKAAVTPNVHDDDARNPTSARNQNAPRIDELTAQLHEHVDQGRIFDARSVVHEIHALEGNDAKQLDEPTQHLLDEVLSQSAHVESLLHELHSDDDWTLAKQKSGVTIHYRREADSPIHTVRAVTTFDNFSPKDFVRLCSLFVETEYMHKWFPGGIMKRANLLSWHSKYSKVIQLKINLGLPMISSRDAIVLGNGYHLPDRNAFLISTKTILEDTSRYCDIPKPDKGVVRMATDSIFYMELVKSDVISFKMIGRDDLKFKYMPSTLLNYISQGHMPFDLMRTVRRTISGFEGTIWEQKIEERGAYYKEIEDKVHVQLRKWNEEGVGGRGSKSHKGETVVKHLDGNVNKRQGQNRSSSGTQHYTEKEFISYHTDQKDAAKELNSISLVVVTQLSTLIASTLYFVLFPDSLSIIEHSIAPVFSGPLPSQEVILAAIAVLLLLPFMIVIFTSGKRAKPVQQEKPSSLASAETGGSKPSSRDGENNEFDEFLNFINTNEKKEGNPGEGRATSIGTENDDDQLRDLIPLGTVVESNGTDGNIDQPKNSKSDVSVGELSGVSSDMDKFKPQQQTDQKRDNRSDGSVGGLSDISSILDRHKPKFKKVRSTVKGIKNVASQRVGSAK